MRWPGRASGGDRAGDPRSVPAALPGDPRDLGGDEHAGEDRHDLHCGPLQLLELELELTQVLGQLTPGPFDVELQLLG